MTNPLHRLRAAIYVRVSKDKKRQGKSVSEQGKECQEACGSEGFTVEKLFCDNDKSASRHARSARVEYLALLEYLATGQADVLVIWESSRGSRELEEWSGLLNLCRRMKILIHVVSHRRTYDLENPREWRTLAEDGIDSQYESEKIRERIKRSMRANQAAGRPHGKLLYGYSRLFDERGRPMWVVNEDQAAIVREAAERFARHEKVLGIAQDFNARGVPTSRAAALPDLIENELDQEKADRLQEELAEGKFQWNGTSVKRLVSNPAYIGKRCSATTTGWKIEGDAVWDAILDEQTFQACVGIISGRRQPSDSGTMAMKHLLTGIARTPCGATVRIVKQSYECMDNHCVSIAVQQLDEYVITELKERLIKLSFEEEENPNEAQSRAQARAEAESLRQYLEEFTRDAVSQRLSAARIAAVERETLPRIEALEARARAERIPKVLWVLSHQPETWDGMTIGEKRETLRRMVTVSILGVGRGRRKVPVQKRIVLDWTEDLRNYEFQADLQAEAFERLS